MDFEAEHARRLQHEKLKRKAAAEMTRIKEIEERQRQEEEENLRSYASVFSKLENNFNNEAGNKNSDHIKENRRQLEEDFF